MTIDLTTYYLEMTDPAELRPAPAKLAGVDLRRAEIPAPELNRFLYTAVGGDWYWIDRLSWSYDRWVQYLSRQELETWVISVRGTPAGYFELEKQPEDNVEIAYFGLLSQFVGKGIGGFALTATIERAWAMGAKRVWVHTCTLDHPQALANYIARGFRQYHQETEKKDIPERPIGPWPGAREQLV